MFSKTSLILDFLESHEDERGSILSMVNEKCCNVSLITSQKGSLRGNHYHKETIQFLYVLEGKILVASQIKGEKVKKEILESGSMLFNEASESHAIKSLEDSKLLILTRGLRGGKNYESDTFKLDEPLLV